MLKCSTPTVKEHRIRARKRKNLNQVGNGYHCICKNIWGERAGAIAWDESSGIGYFEYDPQFRNKGWELSPLEMPFSNQGRVYSFPILRNSATFRGLPGLVADSLPDKYGNALINTWLSRNGRATDSLNPVEILCFIGSRGMGALEFEPVLKEQNNRSTRIEIESLVEIAEEILTGRRNFKAGLSSNEEKALSDIIKIGTSAGGARAKAVIAFNEVTGELKSGQADVPAGFSHWLIKFDGVTDKQFGATNGYGRVEMAYYLMAKQCGIEMSECRLLEENGRAHFMTLRFDREGNEKLHYQSFCALRHFDYNEITHYSYEQLFETMRMLGLPYPQAEELFRRMVFNVMSRNCDDHTKNFAFLMNKKGSWRLSPAFDVCHAFRPESDWVSQHALSINGKRTGITREDLLAVAHQMNIKKGGSIITHISGVIKKWNEFAEEVKLENQLRDAIGKTHILL